MQSNKRVGFVSKYNPPFYLRKINNYQKAVYERKGHWTEKEKVKYGVFMEIYRKKFEDRENPILNKMFRVMSDFMKTRNHNQCRSHHQKMERERFQIDSILESIKSKYHPREYELFFQKYSKHINALNTEAVLNEKGFTPHKNVEKRKKQLQKKAKKQMKLNLAINQEFKQCQEIDSVKNSKVEDNQENSESNEINQTNLKIKITEEKQILLGIEGPKSTLEVRNILPILSKTEVVQEKQIERKDDKGLKKTSLEYDSDEENGDDYPKVAYVDIPVQAALLNPNEKMRQKMNLNMPLPYHHLTSHSSAHLSISQFGAFPNFEQQFSQTFPMCSSPLGYDQNYNQNIEVLEQRKIWHLNEANRLCTEMNEHLQRASMCQQMKQEIMKKMMEIRRGYYYSGQFASSQF